MADARIATTLNINKSFVVSANTEASAANRPSSTTHNICLPFGQISHEVPKFLLADGTRSGPQKHLLKKLVSIETADTDEIVPQLHNRMKRSIHYSDTISQKQNTENMKLFSDLIKSSQKSNSESEMLNLLKKMLETIENESMKMLLKVAFETTSEYGKLWQRFFSMFEKHPGINTAINFKTEPVLRNIIEKSLKGENLSIKDYDFFEIELPCIFKIYQYLDNLNNNQESIIAAKFFQYLILKVKETHKNDDK